MPVHSSSGRQSIGGPANRIDVPKGADMNSDRSRLRFLPAVERVLNHTAVVPLCTQFGRGTVTTWVREILAVFRNGESATIPADADEAEREVVRRLRQVAERAAGEHLQPVINGTGIVIHTNLGRAPLAAAAIEAMTAAAGNTNLEFDLASGERGRRGATVEKLCRELTGAEGALIVNNCAAATLLALQTLAAGRRVVISRGQLIEIGGSFRLPAVFQQAGVVLHEVGTTNRTHLSDYAEAIARETGALLRVHPSNYRILGFSESVTTAELATLARQHQIPMIDDVGSGSLYNLDRFGLADEPVVSESIRAGADLVLFSGDKLLGGPQCGIIVGRRELVDRLRNNPLCRALRVDKLTFAALQATLEIHRAGRAFEEIPVLRQLALTSNDLRERAEKLVQQLQNKNQTSSAMVSTQAVDSAPGGGALPGQTLASWAIALMHPNINQLAGRLRLGSPAVVPRVNEGKLLIDLRTVSPGDEAKLVERILDSLNED